jgi:hypothetical protein
MSNPDQKKIPKEVLDPTRIIVKKQRENLKARSPYKKIEEKSINYVPSSSFQKIFSGLIGENKKTIEKFEKKKITVENKENIEKNNKDTPKKSVFEKLAKNNVDVQTKTKQNEEKKIRPSISVFEKLSSKSGSN